MDRSYDSIVTAHTRSVDAKKGYHKMIDKAEPSFRPVAQDFANLHAVHANRLERILRSVGEEPDTEGSFMAKIHETVVSARALFDEIDHDVMGQIESGEDWMLKAFDDAISDGNAAAFNLELREMRGEIADMLARYKKPA